MSPEGGFATNDSAFIRRVRSRKKRYPRQARARTARGTPTATPTIVGVFEVCATVDADGDAEEDADGDVELVVATAAVEEEVMAVLRMDAGVDGMNGSPGENVRLLLQQSIEPPGWAQQKEK